ncbi:DUF7695 domain-containing protein [Paenibacillus anseongensis]
MDKNDLSLCKCGKVGVDGGLNNLQRSGNKEDYVELVEWI